MVSKRLQDLTKEETRGNEWKKRAWKYHTDRKWRFPGVVYRRGRGKAWDIVV